MLAAACSDLLFPRACAACGGPAGDVLPHFCWDCLAGLEIIRPPFCQRCGDPAEGLVTPGFSCGSCLAALPAFDLARSAVRYRGALQAALQDFKYHGAAWLSRDFGRLLLAAWQAHGAGAEVDALVYVPLFPAKERERSYNQAALLAREFGRLLRGPPVRGLLTRLAPTPTQTRLTAAARRANVRGVFGVRPGRQVAGGRFLLVDDVMTTGATVHECARALKQAGADKVYVLTVARG